MRLHKTGIAHSYQCLQCFAGPDSGVAARGLGIVNVHTDVDACDCTRGLCKHYQRVSIDS